MATVLNGLAVSDDDLVSLSNANPGYRFERFDDGRLIVSPTHTDGGAKSGEAFGQLREYAKRVGGKAYDSSTGFKMPGGGVLSPDAAWIAPERVARLAEDERLAFRRVAPDVVIEVRSDTDDWQDVRAKIDRFAADEVRYAVAIDPESGDVYERGLPPEGLALDVEAIVHA